MAETQAESPDGKRAGAPPPQSWLQTLRRFMEEDLWDRDLHAASRLERIGYTVLRMGCVIHRKFRLDNCGLHASALTYITLMSMVPVLAIMLSVSKGMGAQSRLMAVVGLEAISGTEELAVVPDSKLSQLPEQAVTVIRQVFMYVEKTNFKTLGGIGLVLLLLSVLKSMSQVEHSFNIIWGGREKRTFLRRTTDYVSVLFVVPILIIGATSVNTMLSAGQVMHLLSAWTGPLFLVYQELLRLSGVISIAVAFAFLYMFMPNTRVRLVPALVAGVVAGLLWYGAQWVYIEFQVGVTKRNAIYGTFAAVPFFLAWLYANWTIVLVGAEISFAMQNVGTFGVAIGGASFSLASREMLGLVVVYEACRAFERGDKPWSAVHSEHLGAAPGRLLRDVVRVLAENGILRQVVGAEAEYLPGRDLSHLTVADVEAVFRGTDDPALKRLGRFGSAPVLQVFDERYSAFSAELRKHSFRDLLARS